MAHPHPDSGWIYQCDDIIVEPRAHRLERAGLALSVEPKAYAVLVVLLQQAGEVVGNHQRTVFRHQHVIGRPRYLPSAPIQPEANSTCLTFLPSGSAVIRIRRPPWNL